jgi:DNA replication and repair protein RecF
MICQLRPNYAAALGEYQRILEQKAALLKDRYDHPYMLEILPEYNQRLIQFGALLISYRARYLKALEETGAAFHKEFSGDRESLTLAYETVSTVKDPFAPVDVIRQWLREHLDSHSHAELESGSCLSGPHKDDFTASLNGLPMGAFASQGQTRTATISIKLAERELVKRDTGEEPLLLLDDVLSELDAGRQDFVLNQLKSGQVFITCCETDRWTTLGQVLRIENGSIVSPSSNV